MLYKHQELFRRLSCADLAGVDVLQQHIRVHGRPVCAIPQVFGWDGSTLCKGGHSAAADPRANVRLVCCQQLGCWVLGQGPQGQ